MRLIAQENEQLFDQGNTYYQNGQFEEALNAYQKIINKGYESGSLYFNIGNCYYKLNDVGKTILNYERARRLIPNDEDLKANLAIAQLSVVDKIEPQKQFILFQITDKLIQLLPLGLLIGVVAGSYIMTAVFLIVWTMNRKAAVRYFTIRMVVLFGVLFLFFGLALLGQVRESGKTVEAVILVDKVDVMSAPGAQGGTEIFSLHEGTKVEIDQMADDWVEIILPDRKVGWVKQEVIEII